MLLAAGAAATAVTASIAARPGVTAAEAGAFRLVNALPASLEAPLWAVMQLGSLGAVPAGAATARVSGRRLLAIQMLVAGGTAWTAAKLAKVVVARGRPGAVLTEVLHRGPPPSGQGFPSGHASVAAALAAVAAPAWATRGTALWSLAGVVGLARMYVGAHLPVDVIGGWSLGVAIGSGVRLGLHE